MAITADSILRMPAKNKVTLVIVIILVISGLYYVMYYMPKAEERSNLTQELSRRNAELVELRKLLADEPRLKEEIALLDAKFKESLQTLPEKREMSLFLTDLSNLRKEVELEFFTFKPLPEVFEDFYAKIPVEISLGGSYHNVAMFFDKVSKMRRIVNISNLTIEKATHFSDTVTKEERQLAYAAGRVEARALATTYRFLTPEEAAKVAEEKKKKQEAEKKARMGGGEAGAK